ncbi:MAG: PqqD family protein, partial [Oscillospiraceae bacterium]
MIHQYKLNGFNIVLDIFSGAVHSVDELAYDVIALYDAGASVEDIVAKMLEKYAADPEINEQEIRECISDVEELKAAGQLFAADCYESHACDLKNK